MQENEPIDTESQRRALEEMSQALLGRLNTMVAEQDRRSAEFAAGSHSLSPLPEMPQPQVAEPQFAEPQVAESQVVQPESAAYSSPAAQAKPPVRRVSPPPMRKEPAAAKPQQPKREPLSWHNGKPQSPHKATGSQGEEEGAIGPKLIVGIIFVIYIIIRVFFNK